MTSRDRTVLTVVAALVLVAAAWFLLLAPVRNDAKALDAQIAPAQARLTAAQSLVAQGETAQAAYRTDYAAVSRLGKAVPSDDDVPSLVVQIESAAHRSRVDFRSIELSSEGAAAAAPAVAQVAAVGAAEKGQPAPTGATGTTGATGPAGAAVATQAAAAALPPGAIVGSAGFATMPFDFAFTGSFFKLQNFLARLDRFTQVAGEKITVRGRLLNVDGFSLTPSTKGFPNMLASVHATAYLLPREQGAPAGASPAAPAAGAPAAPTAAPAPGAPVGPTPTAAVTGVGTP